MTHPEKHNKEHRRHKENRENGKENLAAEGESMPSRPNPAQIHNYLKGLDYPTSKDKILERARSNNAPKEVIDILVRINGNVTYGSSAQVSEEVGGLL